MLASTSDFHIFLVYSQNKTKKLARHASCSVCRWTHFNYIHIPCNIQVKPFRVFFIHPTDRRLLVWWISSAGNSNIRNYLCVYGVVVKRDVQIVTITILFIFELFWCWPPGRITREKYQQIQQSSCWPRTLKQPSQPQLTKIYTTQQTPFK